MDAIFFLAKWFTTVMALYFAFGIFHAVREQIIRLSWTTENFAKSIDNLKKQIDVIAEQEELRPTTVYLISFLRRKPSE